MQAAQKLMASIQPNFISFQEYNQLFKTSVDLQVDKAKKEEMQDIHREIVKSNLKTLLKQTQQGRKKR
jgi:hypothetical protein